MKYKQIRQEDKRRYVAPKLYRELTIDDIKIGAIFEENSTDYDRWTEIKIETEEDVKEWKDYFLNDGVPSEFRIRTINI